MEDEVFNLSVGELEEVSWGDDERFELIEDGDWVNDDKYQEKTFIFKSLESGKLYEGWILRSGSYWNDYDTIDAGCREVVKVVKMVEEVAYVSPENVQKAQNKTVNVSINGCDDSTVFDIELEEHEIKTLHKISELSLETSQYGCQPVLEYSISKGEKI